MLAWWIFVRGFLQVVGQYDRGDATFSKRDAHGTIDEVPDLRGRRSLLDECASDILEKTRKIDLLLIVAAEGRSSLLSSDGQDRHVVETRIVKAGNQMRCARAGRRDANTKFAGKFGIGGSHEGGHFFMARLNELNLAIAPLQGAEYAVDAVSRITKNLSDAPRMEALDYEVANGSAHDGSRECGRKGMLTAPFAEGTCGGSTLFQFGACGSASDSPITMPRKAARGTDFRSDG